MAKAILMCGLPGAGKTVFAKMIAKKRGYRYISIDDMYKSFNGSDCCRDNKFDVWMAFWRQIHLMEEADIDIVVDTNAPTPDDRNDNGLVIDICYGWSYFEVFGLSDEEFTELEEYYNKLS